MHSNNLGIIDLFCEIATQYPYTDAVISNEKRLTYQKLDYKSSMLAYYLSSQGVDQSSVIGLCTRRSIESVIGILAILKIGAVYVPLDPSLPSERISAMVELVCIDMVLLDETCYNTTYLPAFGKTSIAFINEGCELGESNNTNRFLLSTNSRIVFFTSGSTGIPKGAILTEESYINNFKNIQNLVQFKPGSKVAAMASLSFDISLTEILQPLLYGATIYIVSEEIKKNPWKLSILIKDNEINVLQFVPSFFRQFLLAVNSQGYPSVEKLLFIGEMLQSDLVRKWFFYENNKGCEIINLYGPIESAIEVTSYVVNSSMALSTKSVPIGRPFHGIDIFLLDENKDPVNIGTKGQLCISGKQLAEGYLDKKQTEERFILWNNKRLYLTGDLAYEQQDGNLVFVGRVDNQVKIRGYRVELEELEVVLTSHEKVYEAVAMVIDRGIERILIVAVVSQDEDKEYILNFLRTKLPQYMLPNEIIFFSVLPKTINGKIDRKRVRFICEKRLNICQN